jgi:hypothetical protein
MLVAVMAVAVTMGTNWGVTMAVSAGFGGCARRAIVRVIPVGMVVGMRVHSRYSSFYACLAA